ncbi:GNAT family N-acetyltransferase [Streptomyces sp. 1331.2]|uniref:GNAT family N-acetyltransferase n=1 Tax=Streptomyces sp. 1331.2 TaxID=1938835 RepID=UPI000BCD8F12|nr:GNAT family N-acetyltransferase [Streptomyces sp. 1331.2]SOB84786.1 Acetyltransferase (GNAT) domain-containing protein [Streptomyces sp. 1331.2]
MTTLRAGLSAQVRIEPWTDGDLALLRRVNTSEMKKHVGGPETEEQLLVRHRRYLDFVPSGLGCMYRIVLLPEGGPASGGTATGRAATGGTATGEPVGGEPVGGEAVGTVGYGTRTWEGESVHEMGWNVLPGFQGRGIAVAATRAAVAAARREAAHRYLHAFPSVDNPASNAVCAKAGFTLLGETDFEFPPGRFMRSHNWRVDLHGSE